MEHTLAYQCKACTSIPHPFKQLELVYFSFDKTVVERKGQPSNNCFLVAQRQHAQKRVTLNGPLLAQFLQNVEQEEKFSLQHEREYEEQALRRPCLGPHRELPRSDEVPAEITIDFSQLRPLSEYR
ncbi:hypothetical protein [Ktedonosporobacter rubrisoli]|uniref:hypothetical protein n=1 Tax=Ktedonosporobacter rubrisoli TaxID=2509675 RepID=UPI001F5C0BDD|nr:hypothetical protein [Ktedonosporobacter rubrisoli]